MREIQVFPLTSGMSSPAGYNTDSCEGRVILQILFSSCLNLEDLVTLLYLTLRLKNS